MSDFPGEITPGRSRSAADHVEAIDVAVDSTGTTELGNLVAREATVEAVRVDAPDAADFDFNVNHNGAALFDADQSPAETGEAAYAPDTDAKREGGVDESELVFEVTSASGTGGATATVTARVSYRADG